MSIDFAGRARALVGTPFRLQGRGAHRLDCVGVAVEVFGLTGVRGNYRMRGDYLAEAHAFLGEHFRRVPAPQLRKGDLMLMRVADHQLHIGVRTNAGFVHAHAGIRRVVETPGLPEWPLLAVYRKRSR